MEEKKLRELGISIASACDWDGYDIMEVFLIALEDANFHGAYKWLDKYKYALLASRSMDATHPFQNNYLQ